MEIRIQKLHPAAKLPTYAHATDAGMDMYTVETFTLEPGNRRSVPTGIAIAIPAGYVGLIWDKSGIAHTRGIKTLGGVIDSGYIGEIYIGIINVGKEPQLFSVGDKLAQLLIQRIEYPNLVEVDQLDDTPRGAGAFGSTGK